MIAPMLIRFGPYAAAALAGAAVAWWIQGVRITAAEQELVDWQQAQVKAVQAARAHEQQVTQEVSDAYILNLNALHGYYRRNPVIRMLPAVGQSGVPDSPKSADGTPSDLVSAAETEQRVTAALESCGRTTLQLITLQQWITELTGK